MHIQDLMDQNLKVSITVGLDDLKEFADYLIAKTKRDLGEAIRGDKMETYPTPKQVSQMLNVDLTTLWRWSKRGYLKPIEIGGKRRYKMSEVRKLLNGE